MIDVRLSDSFADWLRALRDERARARVAERIRRLALGNAGNVKTLGGGLHELRVDYGPGYRIYFVRRGEEVIVLLLGGDKRRQSHDIEAARAMARNLQT